MSALGLVVIYCNVSWCVDMLGTELQICFELFHCLVRGSSEPRNSFLCHMGDICFAQRLSVLQLLYTSVSRLKIYTFPHTFPRYIARQ
jgi:hypothetical protein